MAAEVAPDDAVPAEAVELVELIFYVVRDLLLRFELLHGLQRDIYHLFDVILVHIGGLDYRFQSFHSQFFNYKIILMAACREIK